VRGARCLVWEVKANRQFVVAVGFGATGFVWQNRHSRSAAFSSRPRWAAWRPTRPKAPVAAVPNRLEGREDGGTGPVPLAPAGVVSCAITEYSVIGIDDYTFGPGWQGGA